MAASEVDPGLLAYKLRENTRRLGVVEDWRRDVDIDRNTFRGKIDGLSEDVQTMGNEVKSLRRALLSFALSVAGSAIIFALTVLIATGRL
jgi:hypothetical protein